MRFSRDSIPRSSSGGGDPGGPPHAPVQIGHKGKTKDITEAELRAIVEALDAAARTDLADLLRDILDGDIILDKPTTRK